MGAKPGVPISSIKLSTTRMRPPGLMLRLQFFRIERQASSFQSCKINFNRNRSAGGSVVAKKSPATTAKRSCRPSSSAGLGRGGNNMGKIEHHSLQSRVLLHQRVDQGAAGATNIDRNAHGLRIDHPGSVSVEDQ